jgi:uncharacterized protein with HEPN domain
MSDNLRRLGDYFDHMLQAIARIQRYTEECGFDFDFADC